MKITRNHLTLALLGMLAIMAIASLLGHPALPPDALASLGLLPFAIGEIDGKELKALFDKQAEAYGEWVRTRDEMIKTKAEGKSVTDLEVKINKLSDLFSELHKEHRKNLLASNAPRGDGSTNPDKAEYKAAFARFLRKGDDTGMAELQKKAYNSASGPDGGYLVDEQMDSEILRIVGVTSAIGRLARNVTIGTDTFRKVSKTAGMAARRVGPGATGGESTNPKYAELEYTAHTAEAEPWVFNETLADAIIDLETDLANEAAIAFAELAGSEFANGTGVGSARGITAYDTVDNASYAWGSLGYIASGASGAFASSNPGDNIINLQHALKAQYRPGATWVTSDAVLAQIRQMKDGSGNFYLWQPDPLAGFGGRLLGSPVEIDDNMPALAADSYSLAYGNFAQGYLVINRSGTVVIRDNVTAKGKTKFNFRRRFGGGVQNFEAIKLMKFNT